MLKQQESFHPAENANLLGLAARCEGAQGPDRELDLNLWWGCKANTTGGDMSSDYRERNLRMDDAPRYTASLDAAVTLVVAEGSWGVLAFMGQGYKAFVDIAVGKAATPALSLCAAALRARAA